ncbi:hypothetical protein BDW72DRAFT_32148 [Aspergillus terricola var. indicus]
MPSTTTLVLPRTSLLNHLYFGVGLLRSIWLSSLCLLRAFSLSSRYTISDVYSHQEPILDLLQVPLGLNSDLPLRLASPR